MPKKGYKSVTLPDNTVKKIDKKKKGQLKSRAKVIDAAMEALNE